MPPPDTLVRVFFLMGTLLEIALVGPDRAVLERTALDLHEEARRVVAAVRPLYNRELAGTLRVTPLQDTLLRHSLVHRKATRGLVDAFYRSPRCRVRRMEPRLWAFSGCVWDPSAFLKGFVVDRLFVRLPAEVRAAYLSFGGSSVRVKGHWAVRVADASPVIWIPRRPEEGPEGERVLVDRAIGVSASRKRGEDRFHLYFQGRPLEGGVTVAVVDTGAERADVEATRWALCALLQQARLPEQENLEGSEDQRDLHPLAESPAFVEGNAEEDGPGGVTQPLGCQEKRSHRKDQASKVGP